MQAKQVEGAILPSDEHLLDRMLPEYEHGDYVFDGRFYQTVDQAEYDRRQNVIDSYLRSRRLPIMGIGSYQQWVELDWKVPHGTHQAAEHWSAKMREEAGKETPDALYECASDNQDPELKAAAVEELGDTLWVTCAIASNAGQSADRALQSYLWGDGVISHRESRLTLQQIDKIIADGFTPWFSPIDALSPPEENIEFIKLDEMEPLKNLSLRGLSLALLGEQQFGYGVSDGFFVSWYNKIGKESVAPKAADQVMLIAWYARHFVNASVVEVVEANIQKLRPRVAANLIDKNDGDRSQL